MSPNSIQADRLQQAYLHRDFGDHALGKLGDRSVAVSRPGVARAGGRSRFARLSTLLNRSLDAVTPSSVRAEGKYPEKHAGVQPVSG